MGAYGLLNIQVLYQQKVTSSHNDLMMSDLPFE
jgi:hypothetical protein